MGSTITGTGEGVPREDRHQSRHREMKLGKAMGLIQNQGSPDSRIENQKRGSKNDLSTDYTDFHRLFWVKVKQA
jgi:hypothetical protein